MQTKWKIVPVEPTGEMIGSGGVAVFKSDMQNSLNNRAGLLAAYAAMLSAAPPCEDLETVSRWLHEIKDTCDGEIDIDNSGGPNLAMRCDIAATEALAALSRIRGE